MKGKKPIPTNLKVLKGTDRPCRIRKDEPLVDCDNVAPPPELSQAGLKHWDNLVKQLTDAGVMSNLDVQALGMYCETYARWADANAQIQEHGPIVVSKNGYPTQSPYLQIVNKTFDQLKAMLVEFGMTPSSRTRIGSTKVEKADPVDEFMAKRKG